MTCLLNHPEQQQMSDKRRKLRGRRNWWETPSLDPQRRCGGVRTRERLCCSQELRVERFHGWRELVSQRDSSLEPLHEPACPRVCGTQTAAVAAPLPATNLKPQTKEAKPGPFEAIERIERGDA